MLVFITVSSCTSDNLDDEWILWASQNLLTLLQLKPLEIRGYKAFNSSLSTLWVAPCSILSLMKSSTPGIVSNKAMIRQTRSVNGVREFPGQGQFNRPTNKNRTRLARAWHACALVRARGKPHSQFARNRPPILWLLSFRVTGVDLICQSTWNVFTFEYQKRNSLKQSEGRWIQLKADLGLCF